MLYLVLVVLEGGLLGNNAEFLKALADISLKVNPRGNIGSRFFNGLTEIN